MAKRTVVIGGGISGCAAALELARRGHEVVLVERSANLGGLVVSFSVGGTPLECFYHHIFPEESDIIRLISDLGLRDRLGWFPSTVGVLSRRRFWPFTSSVDLLRFKPLPFVDRLRLGLGSFWLGTRWQKEELHGLRARDWLLTHTGRRSIDTIWDPLLEFKFGNAAHTVPASWMAARIHQRSSARSISGERLGYLRGGFRQLFDRVQEKLAEMRAAVKLQTPVTKIVLNKGRVAGVALPDGVLETDSVLYAGQLPFLSSLLEGEQTDARWSAIGGLGAICVVLELAKPISRFYWTNCCDPALPFGALIEHTNLVPMSDYGRHVAYIGRYFTQDDPVASADLNEVADTWVSALDAYVPTFSTRDVVGVHPFRTPYAAPLVRIGYRNVIPPMASHIGGLYLATTAQIYPQDRGMNEGIGLAHRAVDHLTGTSAFLALQDASGPKPA